MAKLAGVFAFLFFLCVWTLGRAAAVPDFKLEQLYPSSRSISRSQMLENCEILVLAFYPIDKVSNSAPLPELEKLYEMFKDRKLDVAVIVPVPDDKHPPTNVTNLFGPLSRYTFHVLLDKSGQLSDLVGVINSPLVYVITKDGEEAMRAKKDFIAQVGAYVDKSLPKKYPDADYVVKDINGISFDLFTIDDFVLSFNSESPHRSELNNLVLLYVIIPGHNIDIPTCLDIIKTRSEAKDYANYNVKNYIVILDNITNTKGLIRKLNSLKSQYVENILVDPDKNIIKHYYYNDQLLTYKDDEQDPYHINKLLVLRVQKNDSTGITIPIIARISAEWI